MQQLFLLVLIGFPLLLSGCQKESLAMPSERVNTAGTHYQSLRTSDGQEREFIVYIPASAAGQRAVPVLLVLHGTNQSGRVFYNRSNLWNAKADQEGFIVVYPTALVYCHYDEGEQRTVTKWAAGDLGQTDVSRGALPLCPDEDLADDMLFFDELIPYLKENYLINSKRIYATGFSNGAQMTARLAAQRSEVFAAAAIHAGNLSSFIPANLAPRPMSILLSVGAEDGLFLKAIGAEPPLPVDATVMDIPGLVDVLRPFLGFSGLDESYTYSSTTYVGKTIADFLFADSKAGLDNQLRFVLIDELNHSYTEILVDPFWDFLAVQSLP